MRCGIVTLRMVAENGGRLDAEFYLDPTGEIDKDIATYERDIGRKQKKLEDLRRKRKTTLRVFRKRVKPFLHKADENR